MGCYAYFFRSWLSTLKEKLLEEFKKLEKIFRTNAKLYEEARSMIDLEIMKRSHVIGMTTTYAARYQTLLKALKPKIGTYLFHINLLLRSNKNNGLVCNTIYCCLKLRRKFSKGSYSS